MGIPSQFSIPTSNRSRSGSMGSTVPESRQAFGTKAKQFTSDMVFGATVSVEIMDTDRYGRKVGVVYSAKGYNLNQSLVNAGLAWWYRQYAPNDTILRDLEAKARAEKKGLWADPNPIAPWDFRRGETGQKAQGPTAAKSAQAQSVGDTVTVYVTKTGAKYHRDGCKHLSKSKIPMSLEEARGRYEPCSACSPPR